MSVSFELFIVPVVGRFMDMYIFIIILSMFINILKALLAT